MKFTESYEKTMNEGKGGWPTFTADTFKKIVDQVNSFKPADIDKIATKFGLIQAPGTTEEILRDKITYSVPPIEFTRQANGAINANFDVRVGEAFDDDDDRLGGVSVSFDPKTGKIIGFDYGGAGAYFH